MYIRTLCISILYSGGCEARFAAAHPPRKTFRAYAVPDSPGPTLAVADSDSHRAWHRIRKVLRHPAHSATGPTTEHTMSNILTLTIDLDQHELVESNHDKYGQSFFLNSKAGRFVKVQAKDEDGNVWSMSAVQFKGKNEQKQKTAATGKTGSTPAVNDLMAKLDKVLTVAVQTAQDTAKLAARVESLESGSVASRAAALKAANITGNAPALTAKVGDLAKPKIGKTIGNGKAV